MWRTPNTLNHPPKLNSPIHPDSHNQGVEDKDTHGGISTTIKDTTTTVGTTKGMVVEITTTIMDPIKETMEKSMEVKETKDIDNMGANKGSKEVIKGTINKGVTKEVKINNMATTKVIPNKGVAQRETTTPTTKGKPDMTIWVSPPFGQSTLP